MTMTLDITSMETKSCCICKEIKPLDSFARNPRAKDLRQSQCRTCSSEYHARWRSNPDNLKKNCDKSKQQYHDNKEDRKDYILHRQMRQKIQAVEILGGSCYGCGFDHPAALQFHHRDPSDKKFLLSTKQLAATKKYPWEDVLREIDKCDLLCANCHAIYHCRWSDDMIKEARAETSTASYLSYK